MTRSQLVRNAVRCVLSVSVAASISLPLGARAASQAPSTQNAGQESPAQLGKVEVTGTRIKRTDVEQARPVVRLSRQDIKDTGLTSVADVLQRITSSGAAINGLVNNSNSNTANGFGSQAIDLHFLGPKRVLVLVNGRRWIPNLQGFVDLNQIPISVVDHIEILRDGASALYGSDAIAGVVNIITIKKFNGAEASAYAGGYFEGSHRDGLKQQYSVTVGTGGDRGNILFNASYTKREPVFAGDRVYSSVPTFGTGNTRGSGAIPQGHFNFVPPSLDTSSPNNRPAPSTGLTGTQCPTENLGSMASPLYVPHCDLTLKAGASGQNVSDFRPFTSSDRYNFAPQNYLLTPNERKSVYLQGHYDLSDNVTFSSDIFYNDRSASQLLAPNPLFFGSTAVLADIPANQPYNPFDFALNSDKPTAGTGLPYGNLFSIGRRSIEAGPRRTTEDVQTFRFEGGFKGDFSVLGAAWNWGVGYNYGQNREADLSRGLFSNRRLKNALGPPSQCTGQCVPYNLFGGIPTVSNPFMKTFPPTSFPGSITPAQNNYVMSTYQDQERDTVEVWEANVSSSDIYDLPGGPLGVAFGYQYRRRQSRFQPDDQQINARIPILPTNGRYTVNAGYLEINVPIVQDIPFAYNLSTDLATRYSNYDTFGGTTNSKVGIKYQPIHDLLIRATWAQGFRAPNINELFGGQQSATPTANDPCSNYKQSGVSSAVQQRCARDGVPSGYSQTNFQLTSLQGSNPDLKPETALSRSVGFVYSPSEFPIGSFNLNWDYFKTSLENTVQPIGAQNLVNGCYLADNTTDCDRVIRGPSGAVTKLIDTNTNIGGTLVEGQDMGATWKLPSTSFGDFTLHASATYLNWYTLKLPTAGGTRDKQVVGTAGIGNGVGNAVPEWKANATIQWNYGSWRAHVTAHYIAGTTEDCSDFLDNTPNSFANLGLCSNPNFKNNALSTNRLGSLTYFNGSVSYNINAINSNITLGVNNLTDKQPPIDVNAFANSFDPTEYSQLIGRFVYARLTTRF